MTTTTQSPLTCRCGAHIALIGGVSGSWAALDGERPGDFWCVGGQLHAPAENGTEEFPLTCEWCKREPATHVAVVAVRSRRCKSFVGPACANRDWGRAPEIADSPRCAWLFRLVPDTGEGA